MTARTCEERTFATHDGEQLFYRAWPAQSTKPRGAVLLFHRGHEHSGRIAHLVDELELPDFAFFAWDARGNGRSPGPRGYSPSMGASVRDVEAFVRHVIEEWGFREHELALVAQSVGAVLVATWVHDYAPKIRAMVLASPAFRVKLYVPFARTGLRALRAVRGPFYVDSYVKPRFLTHDLERVASYAADPLIAKPISVGLLLGLYEAGERIVADAQAITVPTQLLISGADWVVEQEPQHRFFAELGSRTKERHTLEGFYHDTFGELERHRAVSLARGFIEQSFETPPEIPDLRDAHRHGATRREADLLASPLRRGSLRHLYWEATRLALRVGGWISDGIKLGHQTGFDSGSTLDYVYRNEPGGISPLGRFVDRFYLDSIGWRGIRQRKRHLEMLLEEALERLSGADIPVHILDIAAGHGRYVLDALAATEVEVASVRLRDQSELNVKRGRLLIEARGLEQLARFDQGDAFAPEQLAELDPAPTLAIVSGLYELFSDNAQVCRSLEGLAKAVRPGGYLIYTGQPWHPQLEMIARVLTSHQGGSAWVMRRRSQGELDQLVAAAGFRKLEQHIDEWGIFTVSLAERCS